MKESKEGSGQGNGGTSSAPVYLRLQERARAESAPERRHPKLHRWRTASLSFLLFFAACCLALYLVRFVQGDVRFRLHNVELRGGKYVEQSEVAQVFWPDRDQSIYAIPLEQRRREVEQIPWVRTATVMRLLPDRISVEIEERSPVAFLWTRRGVALVDTDGVILDSPPDSSWTFPVLRGVSEREPVAKRKTRLEHFVKLGEGLRQENGQFPPEISEVDLSEPADTCIVVTDSSGALRVHLGEDHFRERYRVYQSHIAEWRLQFNEIHSIDLRYEGQAVIQSGAPMTVRLDGKPASAASSPSSTLPKKAQTAPTTAAPVRTAL
jgi:cell division protein FtsQ